MIICFFKKCYLSGRKWGVLFTVFLLFPLFLNSQQGPNHPFNTDLLNPNFAYEMQKTTTFEVEKYRPVVGKVGFVQSLLAVLLKGQLLAPHFSKKEHSQQGKSEEEIFNFIDELRNTLNTKSPEKIQRFMSDHNFTKTDKKIAFLYMYLGTNTCSRIA